MTITTPSGWRRVAARRAILTATTILAAGIITPVAAQQAQPTSTARSDLVDSSARDADTSDTPPANQKANAAPPQPNACDGCGGTSSSGTTDLTPPDVYTVTPTGVNVSERAFSYSSTDLSIGSMAFQRFWLGGKYYDPNPSSLGIHQTHSFDIYLKEHELVVNGPPQAIYYRATVHLGNTSSGTYDIAFNVSPRYISPNQDDASAGILEYVNDSYVYTDQAGTVYTFDPNAAVNGGNQQFIRVTRIAYASGRVLTFSYDGNKDLKLVASSDGYAIAFDYANHLATSACGYDTARSIVSAATGCAGAALKTSYGYASGLLTSYSDVLGQMTQYGLSGHEVTCVTPPGYAACKIANEYEYDGIADAFRVKKQTLADGAVWSFAGGSPNTRDPDYQPEDGDASVGIVDPLHQTTGAGTGFTFAKSSPHTYTDMDGRTTQYTYAGGPSYDYHQSGDYTAYGSMLKQVILPEGNEYDASYDPSHFNLVFSRTWKAKPGSGIADVTQTFSYPDCAASGVTRQQCVHPDTFTDAKGNVTNWHYTSFGMPYWEMQPAPMAGAARPLKVYSYGQKNAWVLDGGGNLVTSGPTIWLPASETQCRTAAGSSAATCDPAAPQVTISYEYGADGTADNLLLRGKVVNADGQSLRTCYRYDGQGNKIAETTPRAGLASCPA